MMQRSDLTDVMLLLSPDPSILNANISKAQNFVGYAPTYDIYQGMEEAIEWYIENNKKGKNV